VPLQNSHNQLEAFFPQPVQPQAIDGQETREANQTNKRCQTKAAKKPQDNSRSAVGKILLENCLICNARHRQQKELCHEPCHAFHTALVTLNLYEAFFQLAA
jgi:hypothetical protein